MSGRFASDRSKESKRGVDAMSGWQILTWLSVCVAGALVFLKIVAHEFERSERSLQGLEAKELNAYRRSKADGAEAVTVVDRDTVLPP